eukprot:390415-Pyramimonas_sp.AAC.1
MIDALHSLYLGVFQRFVCVVLWQCLLQNVFGLQGNTDEIREMTLARLFLDLKQWYKQQGIPKSDQLGQLTMKMIGKPSKQELKTKAAETGIIVAWAADVARRFAGSDRLHVAGCCLVDYMRTLKNHGRILPRATCRELIELSVRHITLMQEAGVKQAPKSHMFVHLTQRILMCGNPRSYATFLDESLNRTLAEIAAAANHSRATWERAIFSRVHLLPHVLPHAAFAQL